MFGPLRLTRCRYWSATTDQVTTRWTIHAAVWVWTLAYARPGKPTDRASRRSWGWD
jgi:hypothetical protein